MGQRLNILRNRIQDWSWRVRNRYRLDTRAGIVRKLASLTWPALLPVVLWLVWGEPRPVWLSAAALLALAAGLIPWLGAFAVIGVDHACAWHGRAVSRAAYRPPRLSNGQVDWSRLDYVDVCEADGYEKPRTLKALMEGSMRRLFDLCGDDSPIRARARVMEFARGPAARFKHRRCRRSARKAAQVDDTVMAELNRRFGDKGSDGRYLIDVYLGKRGHNG